MQTKDTVMTMAEINQIRIKESGEGQTVTGWCKIIAKKQADISWKAGEQEGRREVVKCLQGMSLFLGESPVEGKPYQFLACYITKWGKTEEPLYALVRLFESDEWQAKLKEWGLG